MKRLVYTGKRVDGQLETRTRELPQNYGLRDDPDCPALLRPNGTVVAHFGPSADPEEVSRVAWEDHRKIEAQLGRLAKLMGRPR